jgi:phage tail tape-measure protein
VRILLESALERRQAVSQAVSAASAAVGTVAAGPVGTVVGAAVGAIAGGLGGKAVAEQLDPTVEVTSTEPDLRTTTLPHLE